ncbi:MAG: carboxypeptidase regulatory-like domain-containing protein [Acidobacteriota bacterium]
MLRIATLIFSLLAGSAAVFATEIPIRGHVLGPDGEPQARVEVWLEAIPSTYERARLRLAGRVGPEPEARTRSRVDGGFELVAPQAGSWSVVVSAPGFLPVERWLAPLVEEVVLPPVELKTATVLEVQLTDATGEPIAGRVGAHAHGVSATAWRPRLRLETARDDSSVRIVVGREESVHIEARAAGSLLASHEVKGSELSKSARVKLELLAGEGTVVRALGARRRPVAEAVIYQGSALVPFGVTDPQGLLELPLAAEDSKPITVLAADRWSGRFSVDMEPDASKARDLRLEAPKLIEGRVLDLETRDPLSAAWVGATRGETARSDRSGSYSLEVAATSFARSVAAYAAGYVSGSLSLSGSATEQTLSLALAPAARVSGRVVDPEGTALEGVTVALRPAPRAIQLPSAVRRALGGGQQARTDGGGAFRFLGLPANVTSILTFEAPEFAPRRLELGALAPFERRTDLEVVMVPGLSAFGSVVDEDETPVADAEVCLIAPPSTNDWQVVRQMGRLGRDQPCAARAVSDGDGRFELSDLAGGPYDLVAQASGFLASRVPGLQVEGRDGTDLGTVTLASGVALAGRVVDGDRRGIAGATVEVDSNASGGWLQSEQGPAQTDPDGRFVVADLRPGSPVLLVVSKPGFVTEAVRDVRPRADEPLEVVLQVAGRLAGRVVDEAGDPIVNARLSAYEDPRPGERRRSSRYRNRPSSVWSTVEGRFAIENLLPGRWRLIASAKGYQNRIVNEIEVAAGTTREVEVTLATGERLEGTVTADDPTSLNQAWVSVVEVTEDGSAGTWGSVRSTLDAEGRFQVVGVPVGRVNITVYGGQTRRLSESFDIHTGTNVVELHVESGFEVTGQVVASDGTPVADGRVTLQLDEPTSVRQNVIYRSQVSTDAAGSFRFTGVSPGTYRAIAAHADLASVKSEPLEITGDFAGLYLQLDAGATLTGRVIGLELADLGTLELQAYGGSGDIRMGRIEAAGSSYRVDHLATGDWHLSAVVSSSGRRLGVEVEVAEGATLIEKDLEFNATSTLTGIVLDNGQPAAEIGVNAVGSQGGSGSGTTGPDGRFRIEHLGHDSYRVVAYAGPGVTTTEQVELNDDQDLVIELVSGSVSGTVRASADGAPLAGVRISLDALDEAGSFDRSIPGVTHQQSDRDGTFQMPRLRPGRWRLVASIAGHAPAELKVDVPEAGVAHVDLQLDATEGVTFDVALQSGAALGLVHVAILDASGRHLSSGRFTPIDGRVRVSTVPPGRWELVVQAGDSASTRVTVQAPGDQGRLILPTAGTLEVLTPEVAEDGTSKVWLIGPDSKPMVNVATDFDGGQWPLRSGRSIIPGLAPGTWSLTVDHASGETWSTTATVISGETVSVQLP